MHLVRGANSLDCRIKLPSDISSSPAVNGVLTILQDGNGARVFLCAGKESTGVALVVKPFRLSSICQKPFGKD
jgi:hypothetical protein